MSEEELLYRFEADVEDAVANVNRFKSELSLIPQVLREGSYATEETISRYNDFRKEISLQNSAIRTAREAWRIQNLEIEYAFSALNRVSAIGRTVMHTFNTFTMMNLRLEEAQRDVREAQIRSAEAQSQYNTAVAAYGLASSQAVSAAQRLRKAQDDLQEAQLRVTQIQQQNTFAYISFAMQIPSVIYNIYGIIKAINLAKIATGAATVVEWAHNAALSTKIILLSAVTGGAFAVAAAIGATAGASIVATAGMSNYNAELGKAVDQTENLVDLNVELGRLSHMERLQREYSIVRRYYEETANLTKTIEEIPENRRLEIEAIGVEAVHQRIEDLRQSIGEAPSFGLVKSLEDATKAAQYFVGVLESVPTSRHITLDKTVVETYDVEKTLTQKVSREVSEAKKILSAPEIGEGVPVESKYPTVEAGLRSVSAPSHGDVNVSIGRIEVSTGNLGSSLDRDRAADDLVRQIGKKIALRGIAGR